jgi:hypothetical protein
MELALNLVWLFLAITTLTLTGRRLSRTAASKELRVYRIEVQGEWLPWPPNF